MGDLTSILLQCLVIAVLAAMLYALLIRPQQQRLRRHRDMLANLRPGDQIATVGGLVGRIVRTDRDEFLMIEIASGVEIMITRKSVDVRLGKASIHAMGWVAGDQRTAVE